MHEGRLSGMLHAEGPHRVSARGTENTNTCLREYEGTYFLRRYGRLGPSEDREGAPVLVAQIFCRRRRTTGTASGRMCRIKLPAILRKSRPIRTSGCGHNSIFLKIDLPFRQKRPNNRIARILPTPVGTRAVPGCLRMWGRDRSRPCLPAVCCARVQPIIGRETCNNPASRG